MFDVNSDNMHNCQTKTGLTLIEVLVAISIIAILSTAMYATFGDNTAQARDSERQTTLRDLQMAVEQYRNQEGRYPEQGCVVGGFATVDDCANYIVGLTPDYIRALPAESGYQYRVSDNGDRYKLMVSGVEVLVVSGVDHPFARCPVAAGACAGGVPEDVYAVYSLGAEDW